MTREEAEKIAWIAGTADGGCSTCVGGVVNLLNAAGLGWRFWVKEWDTVPVLDDDTQEPLDAPFPLPGWTSHSRQPVMVVERREE